MSKSQKQIGEAREYTKSATDEAAANSQMYKDFANRLFQQQQGVGASYSPMLQQLFSALQGQKLPEGLSDAAKSALTSQALQGIPGQFGDAKSKLLASMTARGFGGQGGSANLAGQMGGIYSAQELAKSNALSNITLQDESLRNQNRQQNIGNLQNLYGMGLSTMNSLGNLYNPASYLAGMSTSTGQQMTGAGQLGQQVQKNWWDQFGGGLLGAGLNLASGGLGSLFNSGSGMNIAAFAPKTSDTLQPASDWLKTQWS